MSFTFSKTTNHNFNDAVKAVTEELKKEGFGVITEIDLREKFKEKLGVDFHHYKILGACNPALAYKAVQVEPNIGVMLPCNVLVQERENGEVEIAAINPLNSIGAIDNNHLQSLAKEVSDKLQAVMERM
ncbi:Uncharacterized conserved protein, DUF302 family [Cnuella takakiae]|uniref:Uncharacterized conserved protein, DUF302 family n=1 Tax=Cnuella takakiae TaxID=1302690 RepID=A0A1M4SGV8_9BACT|nr:DUF302 domain-containing protein [Cnuella takakiae]OLY94503.1 hypothetical protein BUE76_23485 [Cnuella takakiae]SHE31426.1 Uncharacterized conserved protein, DUF302 family [Cnuella takakiae]